jgi:hypothetical protein
MCQQFKLKDLLSSRVVTRTITDEWTVRRWPRGRPWLGRTVASFLKLPGGKTLASARMRTGSVQAMARDYFRGPQTFHSHFLHRLCLEKLGLVCLVHFVVWAAIGGSFYWSYLSLFCRSGFSLLSLLKTISRSLLLRLQWRGPLLAIGHLSMWIYKTLLRCNA